MVADKAVLGGAALFVTAEAETHVDFVYRLDAIHRFDRTVAFLAGYAGPDMRLMSEFDKVGQRIDPIPANLERRLRMIRPWPCNRLQAADQSVPMASDASLYGWHARGLRAPRVLMAVLAGNFVHARMDAMAERDGLLDILTRRPRPLRKGKHGQAAHKRRQGDGDQYPVHRVVRSGFTVASRLPFGCSFTRLRAAARSGSLNRASRIIIQQRAALPRKRHPRLVRSANAKITNTALNVRQEKIMVEPHFVERM